MKTATKQRIQDRQESSATQVQSNTVFSPVSENASGYRRRLERIGSTNRDAKRIRIDLSDSDPLSANVTEEAAGSSFTKPGPQFLGDDASCRINKSVIPIATFASSSPEPEDGELDDPSSPQFFCEAFEDMFGEHVRPGSQASGFEPATHDEESEPTMVDRMHERGCYSYADDPAFQHYLDLACCSDFRLPHEPVAYLNRTQVSQLLSPLIEETPLSIQLIHGLLYALLPSPLHILELNPENCAEGLSACTESVENFAAIILHGRDTPPFLVLGDGTTKTIFVVESETERSPFLDAIESSLGSWTEIRIDVSHPPYPILSH